MLIEFVAICDGTTLDLAALYTIGTATANWDLNGVPVADPTAISAAGNYVLTATNASGCSATATVTVTLEVAPALGPEQVASICSGTSLDSSSYYVTNGLPGFWTLAGVPVANPTTVVNMGSYQLVGHQLCGLFRYGICRPYCKPNPLTWRRLFIHVMSMANGGPDGLSDLRT